MRKAKVIFRLGMMFSLIFMMLISIIPFVSAANDPGHDVLYIEQQGSSELNGTLNISQQLKVANRLYSSYLEILGNGSQPTGSFPQIYATDANTLAINSLTSLYLLKDTGSMVYVGGTGVDLNISGALYLGGNNKLYTSAAGSASSLNLYWGDKLICNASQSNCGWVTTATGGGDITSVQSDNTYIYNGSNIGDVYLRFNESKLNATIDSKVSASNGGNNYTQAIGFSISGSTIQLNLNRSGMSNLTATFTDTGNCSADGSCSLITYDSETSSWDKDSSNDLTTSSTWTGGDLTGTGLAPQVTDSSHAHSCLNITGASSNLCTITDTNTWWGISGSPYLYNNSNILALNETIEAKSNVSGGGWTVSGATVQLITSSNNVSANTLFIDNTNGKVGIGDTTPDALLDVQSTSSTNQLRVSYDDSNFGNISVNSGGNMTIKATGHVIIDIS
jgi:hypothetical protein